MCEQKMSASLLSLKGQGGETAPLHLDETSAYCPLHRDICSPGCERKVIFVEDRSVNVIRYTSITKQNK